MGNPFEALAPIGVLGHVLLDLALILVAARLVGSAFVRVGQPRVVGEIIAGILVGPTVLGAALVERLYPAPAVAFLGLVGQIGLVFYMLLVGLELDLRLLRGHGRKVAVIAGATVAVPVGLGAVVSGYYDSAMWRPDGVGPVAVALFLGAGLSVTAFPVMARILQEKRLMASTMGAVGVGAAALVTVLMFLVIAAAATVAQGEGLAAAMAVRLALLAAFAAALRLGARPALQRIIGDWQTGDPLGRIAAALVIGALAAALVGHWIGVHALVGAFVFGASVPQREGLAEAVIARFEDVVVLFFLPVFLGVSGLATDLRAVGPELLPGLALFVALSVAGKWGAGYAAARLTGLPGRDANTLGVLLNCRGLLILVVALVGLELGVMTPAMQAVYVVAAIVTTLMTGPLVDRFAPEA